MTWQKLPQRQWVTTALACSWRRESHRGMICSRPGNESALVLATPGGDLAPHDSERVMKAALRGGPRGPNVAPDPQPPGFLVPGARAVPPLFFVRCNVFRVDGAICLDPLPSALR